MQWLMLQQDKAEDFCIATGEQYSVRDFVNAASEEIGIKIRWQGEGLDEVGICENPLSLMGEGRGEGDEKVIVAVDPRYFRPTEVETLLGDATKAKEKLGWTPKTTFKELVAEMAAADLQDAKRDQLVQREGYKVMSRHE